MRKVADYVDAHRGEIVARFVAEASRLPSAHGLDREELADHVDAYLTTLAAISRAGRPDPAAGERQALATHVALRLRQGFRLHEVVEEYVALGRILAALWEGRPPAERPEAADLALLEQELAAARRHVEVVFGGYSIEDRQAEKRVLRRLDALAPPLLRRPNGTTAQQRAVLDPLAGVVQAAMEADAAGLLLSRDRGRRLVLVAATGACAALETGASLPLDGHSFLARTLRSDEPVSLTAESAAEAASSEGTIAGGVRSLLALPIAPFGKPIGVVYVGRTGSRPFEPRDRRFFEAIGEHLGTILDRALLAEALESKQRLLEAVFEQTPVGLVAAEAPSGRILLFNKQAERILGRRFHLAKRPDAEELDFLDAEGRPMDVRDHPLARALLRGEEVLCEELEYVAPDGRRVSLVTNAAPVRDAEGRPFAAVTAFFDDSDRRQHEREALRRTQFERHVAAIVSHDLRNPVAAILLSATALLRRRGLDLRQTQAVERILTSAARIDRMVRELLDFTQARRDAGLRIRRTPLDLGEVVRQVVAEVESAHPEREIVLHDPGPVAGEWDGDRLAQVVTNLVTNAVEHGAADTPVEVATRADDGWIALSVHSHGPPIPPEDLERIFEPMERAAGPGAKGSRGAGLGLFIVRSIVEAHGGTVWVRSAAGSGTTFFVRLPRWAAPCAGLDLASSPPP